MTAKRRARARVGAPPFVPPAGFAPVFEGWNVWSLWQAEEPDEGLGDVIMNAGLSLDRQLQIWVEDTIKTKAPGTAVADPLNPAALRGDQIQIIPSAGSLVPLVTRAVLPELAGALQLGEDDSSARLRVVRFFNRGVLGVMPWPHDANYVLDVVYTPDPNNPITSGPAPDSLAGSADELAKGVGKVAKMLLIGGGVLAVGLLLVQMSKKG